jgi:hypothetical protein
MSQAAGMVRMKMGQYHLSYISGCNPQCLKLRTNFFIGMYGETAGPAVERMPCRMISTFVNARCLASVDEDKPLLMLDEPGIDGQPLSPLLVEKHVGYFSENAFASRLPLRSPDLHKAGANGINFKHSQQIVISEPANLLCAGREMTHFLHP